MDRALIERMVGAVVLVLLIVVVAPALLDGRDSSEQGNQPDGNAPQTRTEVIILNAAQEPGAPAKQSAAEAPIISAPQPTVSSPKPVSPPKQLSQPEPDSPPKPVGQPQQDIQPAQQPVAEARVAQEVDGFAVQVGSFSQQDNAQQFADQLKKKGFAVFVTPGKTSAGTVFRVYAGPRSTRSAAENLAGVLKSAGYKTMVIELDANQSGSAR